MKLLCLSLAVVALFAACRDDDAIPAIERPIIRYSSGSPWCGLCGNDTEINPQIIRFIRRESDGSAKVTCQILGSDATWSRLMNSVDLDTFNTLPERIGCPGCTDGAYEWITIETDTSSHNVVFERQDLPLALRDLHEAILQLDSGACGQ